MDAKERGQLIPDLPEELVLAHVVPRLPWFTRPLCRALSKSWRAVLDTRNADLDLRTRMIQLPALRGLFLIFTLDPKIFIRDPDSHGLWQIRGYRIGAHWRKLPPVDGVPFRAKMVASSGMVYVWQSEDCALKLDMGCAEWTWKKVPVPYPFDLDDICFSGKMYVPLREHGVLVHDMMTDKCRLVETWNHKDIRVVSKKCRQSNVHVEEMYCIERDAVDPDHVEVFMYEVESDSWRTQGKVLTEWEYRSHVKLLNSDCFEPASERGINVIWIKHDSHSFCWYSCAEKSWVDISKNPGRGHLHWINFIHGSMYGMFTGKQEEEDIEKEEDGGGILRLARWTIMKGRVIVASKSVAWEEVHEVGFFEKWTLLDRFSTVMA